MKKTAFFTFSIVISGITLHAHNETYFDNLAPHSLITLSVLPHKTIYAHMLSCALQLWHDVDILCHGNACDIYETITHRLHMLQGYCNQYKVQHDTIILVGDLSYLVAIITNALELCHCTNKLNSKIIMLSDDIAEVRKQLIHLF